MSELPEDSFDMEVGEETIVSRSQIKRDAEALQALGKAIYALPKKQRKLVELNDLVLAAFEEANRIKSADALRRHFQYVGKLLRELDPNTLQAARTAVATAASANQTMQTQQQQLISSLLAGGREASEELLEKHPDLERQQLNQLIRNAARAEAKRPEGAKEPPATKKLKQYLSQNIKTRIR